MKLKIVFLTVIAAFIASACACQQRDSVIFSSDIGLYNNGISPIPSFSLGKPSINTVSSVAVGRFSFDPIFDFSTEFKPWVDAFWFHYKIINSKIFNLALGIANSYSSSVENILIDGVANTQINSHSYFNTDFGSSYNVSRKVTLNMYYLYVQSLERSGPGVFHYLSAGPNFTNIALTKKLSFDTSTQVYFLAINRQPYYSFNLISVFRLDKFPVALTNLINLPLKTSPNGTGFLWNVGIIKEFSKKLYY